MALTEVYVDPSIAGNSGAGTLGDPYGDLQHALDTVTRDATNGDRFNIKAGTDEIQTTSLTLATYGAPSSGAPLLIQGYTSAAGDGGEGGITGNGSVSVFADASQDYFHWRDMHIHDTGAATILDMDNQCYVENCRFDGTTGNGLSFDAVGIASNCYFTDIGGDGFTANTGHCYGCVFEDTTANTFVAAINGNAGGIINNLIKLTGNGNGIQGTFTSSIIVNNTVWSDGGTGTGITAGGGREVSILTSNIIAGFSGTGGVGIEGIAANEIGVYGNNAFYNNATDEDLNVAARIPIGGNQYLGSDPFTDASNGDFSVDTSLKALGYPSTFINISTDNFLDIGAAQREEAGSGGGETAHVFAS